MKHAPAPTTQEREFARITVRLRAVVQPVDEARIELLGRALRLQPSVWAPTEERALRDLASSARDDREATLAQAILEVSEQVVRLRSRVLDPPGPVRQATIVQLSGGGGRLVCQPPFDVDESFELRLEGDDLPPIRALGRVVHRDTDGSMGFRFDPIHPADQERLIRLIYQLQRQALRFEREPEP